MALHLMERMCQQQSSEVKTFNAALSCCKKGQEWQEAVGILDAMIQMTVTPNLVTYNTTISCCENAGAWEKALQLFRSLTETWDLRPDVITYSALMSCHVKLGKWEQAISS